MIEEYIMACVIKCTFQKICFRINSTNVRHSISHSKRHNICFVNRNHVSQKFEKTDTECYSGMYKTKCEDVFYNNFHIFPFVIEEYFAVLDRPLL